MLSTQKHLLLTCFFLISTLFGFANTNHDLVNIANEQRILSQRIAKSYLLLAYGANLYEIKSNLTTSISKFESNLSTLRSQVPTHFTSVAVNTINKEAIVWHNLKVNVEKEPNSSNLNRVVELANSLLKKSHLAYTALKTEATISSRNTVDTNIKDLLLLSGKQEILSERLCLYFVAQKINVISEKPNPKILGTLRYVVEKLDRQLIILLETNVNSSDTKTIIDNALISFEDIRTNKTDFLDGKPSMNTIYRTTKELNKLFKALTLEYNKLATL